MDDDTQQPPQRERIGSRAWVRTVGLVGGRPGGRRDPGRHAERQRGHRLDDLGAVVLTEEGATSGSVASEDCPEGAGPGPTDQGTTSSESLSGDAAT